MSESECDPDIPTYDDDEVECDPYDWKQKRVNKSQCDVSGSPVWLERMLGNDTALNIWNMLTLRDVFALVFVSQETRWIMLDRMKKIRYITQRARGILTNILEGAFREKSREFLNIMRDHTLFIGGSSVLHGILYDHPDNTPWDNADVDAYVESDAGFKLMEPKLNYLFGKTNGVTYVGAYELWIYGKWEITHGSSCEPEIHELDIISTNNGIEGCDFTICQNSIAWDGKMRTLKPYDIVHMEMNVTRRCEFNLLDVIETARAYSFQVKDSNEYAFHGPPALMINNLLTRIEKYHSRGFKLCSKIYTYIPLDGRFLADFVTRVRGYAHGMESIIYPDGHDNGVPRQKREPNSVPHLYCRNPRCYQRDCTDADHL